MHFLHFRNVSSIEVLRQRVGDENPEEGGGVGGAPMGSVFERAASLGMTSVKFKLGMLRNQIL